MKFSYLSSYVILIVALITSSCRAGLQSNTTEEDFIEIETTSCLGPCPVFNLRLYNNKAVYNGVANVEQIGKYSATLSDSVSQKINEILLSKELENANTSYRSTKQLDLPTTYLRYQVEGKIKEISIYGSPPNPIKDILDFMEILRNTLEWE